MQVTLDFNQVTHEAGSPPDFQGHLGSIKKAFNVAAVKAQKYRTKPIMVTVQEAASPQGWRLSDKVKSL